MIARNEERIHSAHRSFSRPVLETLLAEPGTPKRQDGIEGCRFRKERTERLFRSVVVAIHGRAQFGESAKRKREVSLPLGHRVEERR